MRKIHVAGPLALALVLVACAEPQGDAPEAPATTIEEAHAYRGDALVVRLVTEAARRHGVPRDLLLAVGWAETRLIPRTGELPPGAHDADELSDDHADEGAICGLFGLDEGRAREEAAALAEVELPLLCEHAEVEAHAAAARLRHLAGGDDAPPLDDLAAWLEALDDWHPALAEADFPYGEYVAHVMHLGFRGEDELGDVVYLPPIDGLVDPSALSESDIGAATGYARPDTPLAEWSGPACDYRAASRVRGDIDYVVIHTCEGGFSGCLSTVRSCGGSVVSAHYVTSYTGYTAQVVEENDIAWHVGCLNNSSIGIEHEGYAGSTNHPDAQMCRSARIVRSICDRWGIPCNRSHIIGHVEANSMFCHGSHWDPGPHWNWTRFMDMVNNGCDCRPTTEVCDGRDNDCDRRVDEGVTNACGTCGATPAEVCNGRDDDCDGTVDDGDVCEIALLNEQPSAYAPPVSTDVDGDGRADLCARGYGGVRCWLAEDGGWSAPTPVVGWGDESGWADVTNYATIRMGDVNGDGLADLCARANAGVVCALSNGAGFDASSTWATVLSDASGANHPRVYTTIRLADVDGDGRDDLCARDSEGFGCWLSSGTAFERRVEGPRWSDASSWGSAKYYGTIRMGDLNGDRRADVCARAAAGIRCALSDGAAFPTSIVGPEWSNESGWSAMQYWSTIRLADVDGDGRDDLCGRSAADLRCVLSTGEGFGETIIVGALSDASGWADVANYATLRVGDVNGDDRDDLCIRANARLYCYAWNGEAFGRIDGPEWSDAGGWGAPRYYQTIRMADVDGDGSDDACARAAAGWRCHLSSGASFGGAITLDDLTNDGGWDEPRYYTTILSAGRACRPEMEVCNGSDDDCDGEIDEDASAELCNGSDDDCDGMVDEHAAAETCNGLDDDCDGSADEGLACEPPDGGTALRNDGGTDPGADAGGGSGALTAGCGCRAARADGRASVLGLGLLALIAIVRRRRR